jgi:hypothetical protein
MLTASLGNVTVEIDPLELELNFFDDFVILKKIFNLKK